MSAESSQPSGSATNDDTPQAPPKTARHEVPNDASESTPLLSRSNGDLEASDEDGSRQHSAASLLRAFQGKSQSARRWPSLIALLVLCVVVILIMVLGFVMPSTVQEYAMDAATFEPTSLSISSFTTTGVRARIQGDFTMDGSKVKKKSVRDLGRFGTWIAREAETGKSEVQVTLPEYGNVVLGTAQIPGIKVNIQNGHTTHVDFLSDVHPGDFDALKRIAREWIDGRLGQLRIVGNADVPLKSGIFSLGTQAITQSIMFNNNGHKGDGDGGLPGMPKYEIGKINVHDAHAPELRKGVSANVSLKVRNDYPLGVTVPPLDFAIMVAGCTPEEPLLHLADATVGPVPVRPKQDVSLNVTGLVRHLPAELTKGCTANGESPLDLLLRSYMEGESIPLFVRGAQSSSDATPDWISDLMSDITVPIMVPGHKSGHLIKNFSLEHTHFALPNPFAEPDTPDANPTVSADIKALIAVPEELNVNLNVSNVKADADVFYHGKKLGELHLSDWQPANSTRVPATSDEGPSLLVQSFIDKAPLEITDDDLFTEVIQGMIFGGKRVVLELAAQVDVQIATALGDLAVRRIPASGSIPLKPIKHDNGIGGTLAPKIGDLKIVDTTRDSLTIEALVNFTNPTEYSATVPYVDIHILTNGTLLAHATARNVEAHPGRNINLPITAVWNPLHLSGEDGRQVGVEFLSQYISGYNTTITVKAHEGSIPSQPGLGRALSVFELELPTPRLGGPRPHDGDDHDLPTDPDDPEEDDRPHFISDATMHLITSTATFSLLSPLKKSTLYVTYINATAFYKGDEVGHIDYDEPFEVPPNKKITSPRLPVKWSLGSVGYDAIRNAVGGSLKLSAGATVGVRLGQWEERIWYHGRSIGAKIRL